MEKDVNPGGKAKMATIDECMAEIALLKEELQRKDAKIDELEQHVLYLETEVPLQSKKRRLDSDGNFEDKAVVEESTEIQRLNTENALLRAKTETPENQLMAMIEEKLTGGLESIQITMEKLINDRLKGPACQTPAINDNSTTTSTAANKDIKTFASIVEKGDNISGTDFRAIMQAAKNEELVEEADRKQRTTNLIIHGKEEISTKDDIEFINNFVTDLQIGVINIKQLERIGQNKEGKRPIKLTFNNEEDQQKVFSNLRSLKGKTSYKGISVKEDYTYNERLLIREFAEQARIKNTKEDDKKSNIIWRVRGSPKNGLRLKWFTKTDQESISQQM